MASRVGPLVGGAALGAVVEQADPPNVLVLHSRTHLPPGWRDRYGAELDWVWTFDLTEDAVPADHVMATGMLRGLKQRVEAAA